MKNYIKIIISFFVFVSLLGGNTVFAGGWNNDPSDCPVPLAIGNYTTGDGIQNGSNGCWTKKYISANAGETINVSVYYDNTTGINVGNAVINLSQSPAGTMTNPSNTFTFAGNLSSNAGSLNLSQVTASLSSSQTLTFGQAKWFRAGGGAMPLPNGQTGYEAFNGGLSLGNIIPGDWGSVIFSFHVGSTVVTPCSITGFSASPSAITSGNSSTLSWNTSNCTSASISSIGNVNVTGSTTVSPASTTSYTLTAYGANGSTDTRNISVNVNAVVNNCVITSFTANGTAATTITAGSPVTLAWSTNNCTSVSVTGPNYNNSNQNFTTTIYPTTSSTYTITAYGASWINQTQTVNITVNPIIVVNNCTISNFTPSQTAVTAGTPVTLTWNTANCNSASISNIGSVNVSGSQVVYPTTSTNYVLTAYGANGTPATMSVFISVNTVTPNCYITGFNASSTNVTSGTPVTLTWNTTNCTSATLSNIGSVNISGSQTVYPTSSTSYTLTAYGANGTTQTQTIYITVSAIVSNCYINNFNANITTITSGSPVTLNWSTNNCTSATLSNIGNVNVSGSQMVYPTSSTSYTLTAYGSNGAPASQTIYITVNQIISNTNVVTITATNITKSTAQVNGLITNTNANISGVYFEYGTTVNLGYKTALHGTNGNSNFSDTLVNLSQDTIYYYRAVADTSTGTYRGAIEIFATLKNGTNPIIIGPTIIGTNSPIMLKIEDRYEYIGVGDTLDYTVYYKNISNKKLTHPMLQVIVPKNITLTNSSAGTYSTDTNTLSVPLNDLMPKDEGTIFVQGHVDSLSSNTAQIVTTAILVYTSNNGAQENAMAYVLNKPKDNGSLLGAAAFFAGLASLGIIGWLILIILLMIIVLIARNLMRPRQMSSVPIPPAQNHFH